jgi:hypothetical protein
LWNLSFDRDVVRHMKTTFQRSDGAGFLRPSAAALVLIFLFAPASAIANVRPRKADNTPAVVELKGIKEVIIVRETLAVDLRPLVRGEAAHVEVVYHLNNQGPKRKFDLIFISGAAQLDGVIKDGPTLPISDFHVWRDDALVASMSAPSVPDPAFSVVLHPGLQTLKIKYRARMRREVNEGEFVARVFWKFVYVLAPAREWGDFGSLEVTVQVPQGWHAEGDPALTRKGDVLEGHFVGIPADELVYHVHAPEGWVFHALTHGSWPLIGAVLLAGVWTCWSWGRTNGRRLPVPSSFMPRSRGLALLWSLGVVLTGLLAIFGPGMALPADVAEEPIGYGRAIAMIAVVLLASLVFILGVAIAQITALRAFHRAKTERRDLIIGKHSSEA